MIMPTARLPQNPCFVVRGEADEPVHQRQWYERPGRGDGLPEVWCYSNSLSYAPGERLALHTCSSEPRVDLEVRHEGAEPRRVLERRGIAAGWHETPEDCSVSGCGWPVAYELPIESDWPSGAYRLTARVTDGAGRNAEAEHLFVLRPHPKTPAERLLLITADGTWCAYNDWGGSNHYEGIIEPGSNRFSPRLSNQRPFARGFVSLPVEAPRTLPPSPPPVGAPVTYPHMEWAWREGYSKKYASAGWASYERHFVTWAESAGYAVDIATQQDLHFRPEILESYRCLVLVGHDEYWSWQMRDAIDAYVERGGHVARFAGNFLWQIRLEDEGRLQVCHKYLARQEDPLYGGPDQHLTTNCWEAAEVGRPGSTTFGLDATRGLYAGWGGLAPRGSGGFTLYRPEHWAFAGSGLGYGDLLGAQGRVFGYEVDGLPYRIEEGLPVPSDAKLAPDGLVILALGLARLRESADDENPEDLFVGDDDARFLAETLYGDVTPETLARIDRGSGMVVHFPKGRGEVFHAGTTEWVAGLLRRDAAVERVTRNVLDRFLA
jgi:hypothetical protein